MTKFHNSNLLTTSHIIDKYDRADIERAYNIYFSNDNLIEVENLIHNYLTEMIAERERKREETMRLIRTSNYVIEKLTTAFDYSKVKESPKFLTKRQEYNRMVSFLDEEEKNKVIEWVMNKGGFEQVLAPEWGKNEP